MLVLFEHSGKFLKTLDNSTEKADAEKVPHYLALLECKR